jgi:hypothetical protein
MGSDHVGKVGWYFYTAFMQLWGSQGMVLEVVKLRSKYPNYAIWVSVWNRENHTMGLVYHHTGFFRSPGQKIPFPKLYN